MLDTVTMRNGGGVLRGRRSVTPVRPFRGALRCYVTLRQPGPSDRIRVTKGERPCRLGLMGLRPAGPGRTAAGARVGCPQRTCAFLARQLQKLPPRASRRRVRALAAVRATQTKRRNAGPENIQKPGQRGAARARCGEEPTRPLTIAGPCGPPAPLGSSRRLAHAVARQPGFAPVPTQIPKVPTP